MNEVPQNCEDKSVIAKNHIVSDQSLMIGASGGKEITTIDGDRLNIEDKSRSVCTTNITAADDSSPAAKNHTVSDQPVMKETSGETSTTPMNEEAINITTTNGETRIVEKQHAIFCTTNIKSGDDSVSTAKNLLPSDKPVKQVNSEAMSTTAMDGDALSIGNENETAIPYYGNVEPDNHHKILWIGCDKKWSTHLFLMLTIA